MRDQLGTSTQARALNAALDRLPLNEFAIRKLMMRSEDFRELCADLAEAEAALAEVSRLPVELREARAAEWRDLIDRLVSEIRAAVNGSEVRVSRRDY